VVRRPCSPLLYLHSPPTPRSTTRSPTSSSGPSAGLPAPPPPRCQRAQREGGRGETKGSKATEAGAAARTEARRRQVREMGPASSPEEERNGPLWLLFGSQVGADKWAVAINDIDVHSQ
jgi:hypothetical protein